jgi:MoaA/NifB/PqqE/SkfB family radical SAM enzyme
MKRFIKKLIALYFSRATYNSVSSSYKLLKFKLRKRLDVIEFHLAEHCNLNCAGCDHFSPLALEEYADVDIVNKDMERLAFLTKGQIKEIRLIGGEPLLHKNVTAFFGVVRSCFPQSRILLFTNGILLAKQSTDFWEACKNNKIVLFVTRYPIKIDTETITTQCAQYGVEFLHPPGIRDDEMYRCALSLEGKGNVAYNWKYCMHNVWTFLRNGRIYPCPFYANIRHFNRQFNMNLPLAEKDSIDIYRAVSIKEILRFLAKPIPACRYCDIAKYTYGHKWEITKKDMAEWT